VLKVDTVFEKKASVDLILEVASSAVAMCWRPNDAKRYLPED